MAEKIVYLVWFDVGFYADKQPEYHWSYTDDPLLAKQYKTEKAAHQRGEHGINLIKGFDDVVYPKSYEVQRFKVVTAMEPC
jgi:hypothetical protein